MIRNKYIILPFLLTAWTIIFVHSIIPHHHHSAEKHTACNYCCNHELRGISESEVHENNHTCNSHTCHFHVDIVTKISIDNNFIVNTGNFISNYLIEPETKNYCHTKEFVPDQISKNQLLRGPPGLV